MVTMRKMSSISRFLTLSAAMLASATVTAACAGSSREFWPTAVTAAPKAVACDSSYVLHDGSTLSSCGGAIVVESGKDRSRQTLLRLQDDRLSAVMEIEMSDAGLRVGRAELKLIVLLDIGNEGCFGTYVLGIGEDGTLHRWGTADEVLDRDGETLCASSKMSVRIDRETAGATLLIAGPYLLPRKDGTYEHVNGTSAHALLTQGRFVRLSARTPE
jgi:hypothetical protein